MGLGGCNNVKVVESRVDLDIFQRREGKMC